MVNFPHPGQRDVLRSLLALLALAVLLSAGCATRPYQGIPLEQAGFLQRAVVQAQGDLVISAAVPDAAETRALTGLDLYRQGIQPVWIKVENRSEAPARVVLHSIDPEYYSPIEVAYKNRRGFSEEGYRELERWFHEHGMPRETPAGATRSGLVFTHLIPGSKGFNLTVFNRMEAHDFTFFVPLPGFVADFMQVDFAALYSAEERRDLGLEELRVVLEEELPCCALDPSGELQGGPLNVAMIGTGLAVRRAMLRGGWTETAAGEGVADRAREQRFRSRQPDAIFSKARHDGDERIQIHLWLAPWSLRGVPVWVGSVFYFTTGAMGLDLSDFDFLPEALVAFAAQESVSADVDSAQAFLFQNSWYNGSLKRVGYVDGVGASSIEEPALGFGGVAYFTSGRRLVLQLSEDPTDLQEIEFLFDLRTGFDRESSDR
jgi:hypothetical protein